MTLRDRWEALSRNSSYVQDYEFYCSVNPLHVIGEDDQTKDQIESRVRYEAIRRKMKQSGILTPPDPKKIPEILTKAKEAAEEAMNKDTKRMKESGRHDTGNQADRDHKN